MICSIKNCNNIKEGEIKIEKNKLNIKYGVNGTGKSTISKAIKFKIESQSKLSELTPFIHRNTQSQVTPQVTISEDMSSVLIFNEEYLNQFLFKEEELISNSYEIFINTDEHKEYVNEINIILSNIKEVFSENNNLEMIISDFESLSGSFKTTNTSLSKASAISKGLKEGNKINNIPSLLSDYRVLIQDDGCISWLDWHNKGEQFFSKSTKCPYCSSATDDKIEKIKAISTVYDKNTIKNLKVIIDAIARLGEYFSSEANETLRRITTKASEMEVSEKNYIVTTKQQIDNLIGKLKNLKSVSVSSFNADDDIKTKLTELKISMDVFDRFSSTKTKSIVESLNASLDSTLEQIGILKGKIAQQKRLVSNLISNHKKKINAFLTNAGYDYTVEIINKGASDYKLLLKHKDANNNIGKGDSFLSYGERNAFALVLFMYEVLSKKPDLIILDDPISSFDKNKKYAIMHMLFRGDSIDCLKSKTVLMLTHDLDPVIDTVKVLKEFGNIATSSCLTTRKGLLNEEIIQKEDLMSFAQICRREIISNIDDISKLIYLRRYFETTDNKGDAYEVLSNLFHKRGVAMCKDQRKPIGNDTLDVCAFNNGVEDITKMVTSFNYQVHLDTINNIQSLKDIYKSSTSSYVKINIFRLIMDDDLKNIPDVLRKFINESYHIENELIYQLNPHKFNLIPDYITDYCDKFVE